VGQRCVKSVIISLSFIVVIENFHLIKYYLRAKAKAAAEPGLISMTLKIPSQFSSYIFDTYSDKQKESRIL
jgi:hypothetical protein